MRHKGRVGLVRHGETFANTGKVWHGQTDTELTALGLNQAKRLGAHFHHYMKPDVIFASPLQRARITAESIASQFGIEVQLDPRLMEFDLGDWEGRSFESLINTDNIFDQLVSNPDFQAPGGESQALVKKRIVTAIDEIVDTHAHENIIIVAHGVAIGIALSHYLNNDTTRWPEYGKHNTAFSELCLNTNSLLSFNQIDHLKD